MIPKDSVSDAAGWDPYFALVRTIKWADVESVLKYKRVAEQKLQSVTTEDMSRNENWIKGDFQRYLRRLVDRWRVADLVRWHDEEPERASAALRDLWGLYDGSPDGLPPRDEVITRIRIFSNQLPDADKSLRRPEGRMGLIAALLTKISAEHYPPYMVRMFNKAYKLTDHPKPPKNPDEATLYEHALEFLDKFVEEARARRLEWPRSILEAQSVVYMLR